jgi:hypothetical protein
MKSVLKAFSAVALSATIVHAGTDQKDLKKVIEDQGINYVETAQKGITLSGYVDTSYTQQFAGAGQYATATPMVTNGGGGPANTQGTITNGANAGANIHQFDTSNSTFNVNAVKLALEKALPDKNEWAAGFRIDTIYGSDAKYLSDTAFNGTTANTSGLALEQALVKFRIPVGNGLDIYMGKFVTFLGYEVIESPANLNFSRGLLFTNAIPLTHTGIYADYKFNDTVEAKFGIVDGWNNATSSSVGVAAGSTGINDDGGFGKTITGQLTINAPGKNANITQSFVYSPNGSVGTNGVGVDNGPLVVYDIWGNWNPTFVKDNALTLGLNADLGYNGASGYPGAPATASGFTPVGGVGIATPAANGSVSDSNTWYGVAAYASYKVTKVVTLSARGEYLHEDASWNPKFGATGVNNDDFSETLTASFNIWDNLLTRIEYRYDHYTSGTVTNAAGNPIKGSFSNENEISLNAVYSF